MLGVCVCVGVGGDKWLCMTKYERMKLKIQKIFQQLHRLQVFHVSQ